MESADSHLNALLLVLLTQQVLADSPLYFSTSWGWVGSHSLRFSLWKAWGLAVAFYCRLLFGMRMA
jgi:hypothetical protein